MVELIHTNARHYNMLRGSGVERRVGAFSLPNDQRSLERRYAASNAWNVDLLDQIQINYAAAWTIARVKGDGVMKRRIAVLRDEIDTKIKKHKRDGIYYELWGDERNEYEKNSRRLSAFQLQQ